MFGKVYDVLDDRVHVQCMCSFVVSDVNSLILLHIFSDPISSTTENFIQYSVLL